MTRSADVVFLIDCDNTLLDNDAVIEALSEYLTTEFGPECRDRYWEIYEARRTEVGYADYLGALQRYRLAHLTDSRILGMSSWLVDYPFADRLYPDALAAIARLDTLGTTVLLTDGDAVFQPRKVIRSGLRDAFGHRVEIYIHKEEMLDVIRERYPARHYVLIDDKLRLLAAFKTAWGEAVTTVFPRQGHYAHDAEVVARYPAADVTIERIGDLLTLDPGVLMPRTSGGHA
ncbi:MAG TPA: HAD family hydrolase [Gemmatimonadales bacterium]|nr:HAD family hydrolase [Gemmatimonadales bacterium]